MRGGEGRNLGCTALDKRWTHSGMNSVAKTVGLITLALTCLK